MRRRDGGKQLGGEMRRQGHEHSSHRLRRARACARLGNLRQLALRRLYAAPGNPGMRGMRDCVDLDIADHDAVIDFCPPRTIDLVVVGPEAPLVAGLVDDLGAAGIKAFGPAQGGGAARRLEGASPRISAPRFGIPTAAYRRFTDAQAAKAYVAPNGAPIVVKADGLAAGKGVVVATTAEEAEAAIDMMLGGASRARPAPRS